MKSISTGRRRAYRHRHKKPMGGWAKYVIGVTIAAILIFVFAVALGSKLGQIADNTNSTTVPPAPPPLSAPKVPVIFAKACPLTLPQQNTADTTPDNTAEPTDTTNETESTTESTTASETTTAPSTPTIAYNAVSVLLSSFSEDGSAVLHYSSPLALKYGLSSDSDIDLGTSLLAFGDEEYVSGVFSLSYPSAPAAEKNLAREYELALLCEIASYGIDEIVLLGFSSDTQGLSEANAFTLDLLSRENCAELSVGIALSHELIERNDAKDILKSSGITKAFIALDFYSVSVPELMTAEDFIHNKLQKCANTLSTYNLRLLLGCGKSPDLESQVRIALQNNIYNIQEVGK